jgi:hypothetical protein
MSGLLSFSAPLALHGRNFLATAPDKWRTRSSPLCFHESEVPDERPLRARPREIRRPLARGWRAAGAPVRSRGRSGDTRHHRQRADRECCAPRPPADLGAAHARRPRPPRRPRRRTRHRTRRRRPRPAARAPGHRARPPRHIRPRSRSRWRHRRTRPLPTREPCEC